MSLGHFAEYTITRRLAGGGLTFLDLAVSPRQERVVIRRLRPEHLKDRRIRTAFDHGAGILKTLDHPNIVRLITAGHHHDEPYQVLEYVESHNLRELMGQRDPLLLQNPLSVMRQMAAALAHVHMAGYLHLDFKPDNLLLRQDGLLVLIDFDLAQSRRHLPPKINPMPGTPAYLPPEAQLEHHVSEQTDIYAFGVSCYEILTGHKPFEGVTLHESRKLQLDPHAHPRRIRALNAHVAPAMESVIFKCLAHETFARYPSFSLVLRDLEALI